MNVLGSIIPVLGTAEFDVSGPLIVSRYLLDSEKPKVPVPIPISLVKYLEDPSFEHEDFTLSSAITLRARVSREGCGEGHCLDSS